jgi:NADH-quinone oxidoreductase subunit M
MLETWGLTAAVFLPVVGAGIIALTPKENEKAIKFFSLVFSGLPLLLGILLIGPFTRGSGMRLQVNAPWIPSINARYHVGIDGISLPLLELTFLVTFLCMVYSLWHVPEPHNPKGFLALCLVLETGMAGTFIALDLVLFFIFWELVLVPMYFLIGLWGGPRREYAAIKFFLYTLFGSVFMLLGFLALYFRSTPHTFDILQLQGIGSGFPVGVQNLIFAGLGLGFAIKVPMWPFHTWLPDAHTEAPTVGSVLLAAVLLKMGTYGFIRISMPILPDAAHNFAPLIGALAVIAIVYGSLCCLAQTDLKRMIAFSSVGHMGFVMLGIATMTDIGLNAAIYGMVAHGVITGMLFFISGSIHERYHTRDIPELGGGLLVKMPVLGSLLTYATIASLGLPGLAGFWGEVMALLASYNPAPGLNVGLFRAYMVIGGIGTILTAGYFLWMLQRVNLGEVPEKWEGKRLFDVQSLELLSWAPLLVLIIGMGLFPRLIFGVTNDSVVHLVKALGL